MFSVSQCIRNGYCEPNLCRVPLNVAREEYKVTLNGFSMILQLFRYRRMINKWLLTEIVDAEILVKRSKNIPLHPFQVN